MFDTQPPLLAVVIPTFRSEAWIVDSVDNAALAAQDAANDRRTCLGSAVVIVVDDGSELPTSDVLDGRGLNGPQHEVLVVRRDLNTGQHTATLAGIDAALSRGAACVVTIDDDLLFGADALIELLLAGGWESEPDRQPGLAYGVVGQPSAIRRAGSVAARTLIRWRPEAVATSIRCIPASRCADLDARPVDTQLLSASTEGHEHSVVRVEFRSQGHPLARSRYGIVALLRHAKGYVRSWLTTTPER